MQPHTEARQLSDPPFQPRRDAPMNTEARRLRALAVDSAARALSSDGLNQHSTTVQADQIIALADQLYNYIETGASTHTNKPYTGSKIPDTGTIAYQYDPTPQDLAAIVADADSNPIEPIRLPRGWNAEKVLAHLRANPYYPRAELIDDGDVESIAILPRPAAPYRPEQHVINEVIRRASANPGARTALKPDWDHPYILGAFRRAGYAYALLHADDGNTFIIADERVQPDSPQNTDELRHGYSFQALLTQAKQSGVNRVPLSEAWDTQLILAGFIASGYPDAELKRPLGRSGIFLHPGQPEPGDTQP